MTDSRYIRWPSQRFYWAIIDASAVAMSTSLFHRAPSRKELGYLFEAFLPGITIEAVHAVYVPLPNESHQYLACGLPHEVLDDDVPPTALTLAPDSVPDFVEGDIDPESLNLLIDRHEPRQLTRARRSWLAQFAAVMLLVALAIFLGMERRIRLTQESTAEYHHARSSLIEVILRDSTTSATHLPPELQLRAERRLLEQTRVVDDVNVEMPVMPIVLASLLSEWPDDLLIETDRIEVSPERVSLECRVPDMRAAQVLADQLAAIEGWQMQQPTTQSRRDHVDVSLTLDRTWEANQP